MSGTLPPLVEPAAELTKDEVARYSRHLIIPDVGVTGQKRLKNAKVLVIGAGGLGSVAEARSHHRCNLLARRLVMGGELLAQVRRPCRLPDSLDQPDEHGAQLLERVQHRHP